jgi:hypothetical protein
MFTAPQIKSAQTRQRVRWAEAADARPYSRQISAAESALHRASAQVAKDLR